LSVLDRVFRQVMARPDAPAVIDRGEATSYAALWRRAQDLADTLRREGVTREEVIGLALGRSTEHVVGMLGAWLARAAFLPLASSEPAPRRAQMTWTAGVTRVLDRLPTSSSAHDPLAPPPVVPDDRLAYVIFTSGSTGRPKGVAVEHRGLPFLVDAQVEAFGLGPSSRALFYVSIGFDASISDVCTALASGAALVIEDDARLADPRELAEVLRERAITCFDVPPALLGVLDPERLPSTLTTLVVGGEPSPPARLRAWAATRCVINVYGPTEATVCSSLCRVDPDAWDAPRLGRPIAGTRLVVRGEELWIGGAGVARGYLGEPELTEARFVTEGGERWYRTGDRVALRDRELLFLGRIDRQLKIHGKLVSPEEVEACLRTLGLVEDAAVVSRPEGLVAFITGRASEAAVRAHLLANLPASMAPSRVERLDALPRTASGKPDLAALGTVSLSTGSLSTVPLATGPLRAGAPSDGPLDGAARVLFEVFSAALGRRDFGLDDDFFALGGDSMKVLEVVRGVEARGLAISPPAIFGHPTIRALLAAPSAPDARSADALRADAIWDEERVEAATSAPTGAVFLTGATGFLGARLLVELLERSDARVTCLVRASDEREGRRRIEEAVSFHGLTLGADASRVAVLSGDLERPRMGLSEEAHRELAGAIDAVVHCAARVNVLAPYEALREANVEGTRRALRLAALGPQRFVLASTLSVFVSADPCPSVCREDEGLEGTGRVFGGYAQSKWAAEQLVREAELERTTIVRLGLLTGDTETGAMSERDLFSLFCRGTAELGCVPESLDARLALDVTPVDFAAAAMAELVLCREPGTFHLASAQSLGAEELVGSLRDFGVSVDVVSDAVWRARLANAAATSEGAAASLALTRAFGGSAFGDAAFERQRPLDLFQATGVRFDTARADAILAPRGLCCPPPSRALLARYLQHLLGPSGHWSAA
jgi:amino acid adenylation domain-containing protein/thioester reductase-like protein